MNDEHRWTLFGGKDIIIRFTDLASYSILCVRICKRTGHYEKKEIYDISMEKKSYYLYFRTMF